MKDTLKSAGSFILAICVLVGLLLLAVMFVKGGVWLGERVYPWLVVATAIALFVIILVLLPLAIFRRTRGFAGTGIYIASFVFGLTLWVWSLLISYTLWGIGAVVVGLLFMGVGVVPIAILASLFHGLWSMVGQLLLVTAITFGARFLGMYLVMKSEARDDTPNTALEPEQTQPPNPLGKEERGPKEPSQEPISLLRGGRRARIVWSDDEPLARRAGKLILDSLFKDYAIVECGTGDEAWREISRETPDLLITDLCHPGLGLEEMLHLLSRRIAKFPILVVSAQIEPPEVRDCLRSFYGLSVSLLDKPFMVAELKAQVLKCLRPERPTQLEQRPNP